MGKPGTKLSRVQNLAATLNECDTKHVVESYSLELTSGRDPENAYRSAVSLEHRKRFGQFFTPPPIASLMADWVLSIEPQRILDPAVGPGIFPRAILQKKASVELTCMDIDEIAVSAARKSLGNDATTVLLQQDFLTWTDERLFDAIIANPPYLRHHDMLYPYDIFAVVGRKNQTELSRLSNIYVLFILEICRRLKVGGRAAVIVPGEWVNANFGDTLKLWLISRGLLNTLVYFSHASTQFEEALTTASILFLERPKDQIGREIIRTVFVHEGCAIDEVRSVVDGGGSLNNPNVLVQSLSPEKMLEAKKWNHLLAHGQRETPPGFVPLSEIADTRRGIATGCNSFFHLTPSAAQELHIRAASLTPCVGRALDVAGVIFTQQDFDSLAASDGRTYLFEVKGTPNDAEAKYLRKGESEGLHRRFLCAARNSGWYKMERRPPSAIWATVFGRQGLKFVYNAACIANLTTFHCVYPHRESAEFSAALTACLSSRLVQELAQRQHRVYGGGLLKVEPKDLLDIEVPDLRRVGTHTLQELAALLTQLDHAVRSKAIQRVVQDQLDVAVENAAREAAGLRQK